MTKRAEDKAAKAKPAAPAGAKAEMPAVANPFDETASPPAEAGVFDAEAVEAQTPAGAPEPYLPPEPEALDDLPATWAVPAASELRPQASAVGSSPITPPPEGLAPETPAASPEPSEPPATSATKPKIKVPGSCINCGQDGTPIQLVTVKESGNPWYAGFKCPVCKHTWTPAHEQAPFRTPVRREKPEEPAKG